MNLLIRGLSKLIIREKIALLVATLVLIRGAILQWYHLPPETMKAFEANLLLINAGRLLAFFLLFLVLLVP